MPDSPPLNPPGPAAPNTLSSPSCSWFRRYPVAVFLVALVISLVSAPFDELFRDGDLVEAARLTVVLVSALGLMGGGRRGVAWGLALVLPALVGKWVSHFHPSLVPPAAFLAPGLLFLLFVILHLLRFILRAPRIDSEVLCAGLATYLMLGLAWAFAYMLVARLEPASFGFTSGPAASQSMKGLTALYFSLITLSTVGYGDIVPVSGAARMLTMMEAVTGTLYVATLIARLVSLYSSRAQPPGGKLPASPASSASDQTPEPT